MKANPKYDIFISYRREGGYQTAQLLYDNLVRKGYRVSFDLETLRGGKFNTQLYSRIEQCSDVLVVMSADALSLRENVEDDWFRLEIAHALKLGRNMVPVFLRDFKMPAKKDLPADIADIVDYNGVVAAQEHFDSVLRQICEKFTARPHRKIMRWIAAGAVALLLGIGAATTYSCRDTLFPFPYWQSEKQDFSEIKHWAVNLTAYYDIVAGAEAKLIEEAKTAVLSDNLTDFFNELKQHEHTLSQIRIEEATPSERLLTTASRTPIEVGDVRMFGDMVRRSFDESKETAQFLDHTIKRRNTMAKTDLLKLLNLKKQWLEVSSEIFAYAVMGLFSYADESALKDVRETMVPLWIQLPALGKPWLRTEKDIKTASDHAAEKLEEALRGMSTITGNMNMDLRATEREVAQQQAALGNIAGLPTEAPKTPEEMREKLKGMGATPEQIETMMKKFEELQSKKRELKDYRTEIEATKMRCREKFAPKMTDEIGILWGKALRFLTLDMKDDAMRCVLFLRRKESSEFPEAACTAAEAFISQRGRLPFVAGVMATCIEPPATSHAILEIGDIIVGMDGRTVAKYEDYRAKAGSVYTVYRYGNGAFKKLELTMPEGQPRVGIVNLMEESE